MEKNRMIRAFALAGKYVSQHSSGIASDEPDLTALNTRFFLDMEKAISTEYISNPWFTEPNVRMAMGAIGSMLKEAKLIQWMSSYDQLPVKRTDQKTVGVVMAGNIPMVGFHDFLSVLISGHKFFGKTSSKDDRLIKLISAILVFIEPELEDRIVFTDSYLKDADAQIATGSNNTSRYFDYYFRHIPHIIRKNRNAIAILDGSEDRDTLAELGRDIFSYFGLGCRNITKIYVPENYDLTIFMEATERNKEISDHHKYANNIDYHRSIYLMNRVKFFDNGVLLLKEDEKIASPVGIVFYEKYSELDALLKSLGEIEDQVQCTVSSIEQIDNRIRPGQAQYPELWDYADGIDTLKFLTEISRQDDFSI